jgi:hypothetical protein
LFERENKKKEKKKKETEKEDEIMPPKVTRYKGR